MPRIPIRGIFYLNPRLIEAAFRSSARWKILAPNSEGSVGLNCSAVARAAAQVATSDPGVVAEYAKLGAITDPKLSTL